MYADQVVAIHLGGDPAEKVDLLLLGDGYTAEEQDKFIEKAKELAAGLLATPPFDERQTDFEMRLMHQEKLLEQLNEIVTEQQTQLERLRREVARLKDQLAQGTSEDVNEPPPHY